MKALILAALLAGGCSQAVACLANADLTTRDLLGLWRADFADTRPPVNLVLEPNPQWPGSFAGRLTQAGRAIEIAGDLEDGVFTLEESGDGVRIDATWSGLPTEGSCGREIRGTWQDGSNGTSRPFILRRSAGW